MRQLKILICELLLLGAFVGLFGFYALIIWGKREPYIKGALDEIRVIKPEHKHIWKPKQVEIYAGKWHKDYLEVIK